MVNPRLLTLSKNEKVILSLKSSQWLFEIHEIWTPPLPLFSYVVSEEERERRSYPISSELLL
tara:strand:- start:186 stop:371 length:186 start_codon:yes stop_codon:yes gene_type:complete